MDGHRFDEWVKEAVGSRRSAMGIVAGMALAALGVRSAAANCQGTCSDGPRNYIVCGKSGSSACICLVTVEGTPFCAREADCGLPCTTDADCVSISGTGSACIRSFGLDNFCACSARTFCAIPCSAP